MAPVTWRGKEPWHQQPWHWPSFTRLSIPKGSIVSLVAGAEIPGQRLSLIVWILWHNVLHSSVAGSDMMSTGYLKVTIHANVQRTKLFSESQIVHRELNQLYWWLTQYSDVTMSIMHHVSNLGQLDCVFNSLFCSTTKKTTELHIIGHFWGESPSDQCIPLSKMAIKKWPLMWKAFPWHDVILNLTTALNTLRPRQNGWHFPDDIFKCILLNENLWISIKIPPKFVA